MSSTLSHSAWASEKERALDRTRKIAKRKKDRAAAQRTAQKEVATLHFKKWLLRKTNYEKAQKLLHEGIEASRAGRDQEWTDVGTALAAVDVMLGTYDISLRDGNSNSGALNKENSLSESSTVSKQPKQLKSLRDDFFKWSKGRAGDSRHSFQDVVITPKMAKKFTNQIQETMEEYARSYNYTNKTKEEYVLSSLSYTPPLGRKARSELEAIQEIQTKTLNKIWVAKCMQGWKECQKDVLKGLDSAMEDALAKAEREESEKEEESKNNNSSNIDADYDGDGVVSTEERIRKSVLYSLGLSKLIKMQRQDIKEAVQSKKSQALRKREEGLASHTAWAKNKNQGMIKMPPAEINPYTGKQVASKKPPRMDFSGRGVARPKARTVMQNSVDIMAGSGMKYIHAMGFAKQAGQVGDLERSRMSLVKSGYVNKRNFLAVNDQSVNDGELMKGALRDARENNPALRRRETLSEIKQKRNDADKYEAWAKQKSRSAAAVKYLSLVETPYEGEEHKSMTDGERERKWKRVGRLVKGVDLNLLPQWASWSTTYKRFGDCQNMWNELPPVVPTGGTSGFAVIARDTLLRIFSHRRDYDWHAAFDDFTERKLQVWTNAYELRKTDKAPPKDKKEVFEKLALKPTEVRSFFGDHGIELTEAEVKSLFFVFDTDKNKKMSRSEFMEFAEMAQTSTLNPTSEFWINLLGGRDQDRDSRTETIADWNDDRRDECLSDLKRLANKNLMALERTKVIEEGSAPFPPRLKMERLPSDTPHEQTTTLRLRWNPGSAKDLRGGSDSHKGKQDPAPVVFFLLETGGPMTGRAIKKFVELCKDPPNANPGSNRVNGGFIHMKLEPNTRYQYRLTAFNGFGPSEPVYAAFTTLPMAPPVPRLVSSAVTVNTASVTLEWGEGMEFKSKMKDLRRAFIEMDRDGNGDLSNGEFLNALNEQPSLREFLAWSTNLSPRELFQGIDDNNDGRLTFLEFSNYFLRQVRTNTQKNMRSSQEGEGRFDGDVEVKTSDSGAAVSTGTKFVLNKCVSDVQPPVFTRVTGAPTHKTKWTVEDLVPGQSYQFTVHAMNLDGETGPASRPCVVSTMMQQPVGLRVVGKPLLDSVQLKWKAAPALDLAAFMLSDNKDGGSSLRNSAPTSASALGATADADMKNPLRASAQMSASKGGDWFKQLNDWAGKKSGKEGADYAQGGVGDATVKRVFDRYDVDGSGLLDNHELRSFLKDMGMPYDDDGVETCLRELDEDGNGKVDLNEFITKFWNKHVVSYVVKRDAGTTDAMLAVTGGRVPTGGKSSFDIVYSNRDTSCLVRDLAPNTMYRFTVAFRSHRASSPASTELHVMTPPGPPTQPVAVHTGAREATLKWYPGAGGAAFKYQVYVQKVASRLGGGSTGGSRGSTGGSKKKKKRAANRNWDKCYEGSDTVCRITDKLEPDSMYNFKVVAMNRQYVNGDASLPTQVCTVRKQDEMACTRDTVDDMFTIDCTGDVVTGDTVLFTERVYAAVKATPEQPTGRRGHGNHSRSTKGIRKGDSITLTQSIDSLTPKQGRKEFVTERTVAAVVYKESLEGPRSLSLQVLWSTVSRNTAPAKATLLRSGTIITRQENSLFEFEVLRASWEHEDSRWTAAEERSTRLLDEGLHAGQNSPQRN